MIKILAVWRQRREDALLAVGSTEKSVDGYLSQKVSLTEAKHFLAEVEANKRFRSSWKAKPKSLEFERLRRKSASRPRPTIRQA